MEKEIQNYIGEINFQYSNIAIYGIIQLQVHKYLVLIIDSMPIGQFLDHVIMIIKKLVFCPLSDKETIDEKDKIYIEMITQQICNDSCFYSLTYNLTNTMQYQKNRNRFAINHKFCQDIENKTYIINGLVQIYSNNFITYCQIARRENQRQGRRYLQRGCDQQGNCSSYTEIEEIFLVHNKSVYSFVQIRASLPFKWKQLPTLKFKPEIQIDVNYENNVELCNSHLYQQIQYYREIFILNLLSKKGRQLKLGNYLEQILELFQRREIQYFWYDFNGEKGNYSRLIDEISSILEQYGYYQKILTNDSVISEQKGVFRVNCMSCIDRSNVIQYYVSKYILNEIKSDARISDTIEYIHSLFWQNTGNKLSQLYSGTISQKNDYIKYGKQTTQGKLIDAFSSAKRYFKNHFNDYHIQNSIDLTLGLWDMKNVRFHNYKFLNCLQKFLIQLFLIIGVLIYIGFGILSPFIAIAILYYFPQLYQMRPIIEQ